MDPAAVFRRYDSLGAKNHAIRTFIQYFQCFLNSIGTKFLMGFYAPGGKYLICVVMVMLMLPMVMAAAGAVLVMVVIMLVMVVSVFLMVVAAAGAVLAMVMVVLMMMVFFLHLRQIRRNPRLTFHSLHQLRP